MKVAEAAEQMTKGYLHRIIDSFTKDLPKGDEQRSRDIILRNVEELTDPDRIARVLETDEAYSEKVLRSYILEALLNRHDHRADEEEIIEEVTGLEKEVLESAEDPDSPQYEDPRALDILRSVLEVALEDDRVTADELNLIHRLREKLGVREKSKQILLAQLGHFPRMGNRIHTPTEFREALLDLQKRGVVFYCNRLEHECFVIPEEIVPGVKKAIGVQVSRKGWARCLENLPKAQLATILESAGLPKSAARKEELQKRIIVAGLQPRECLESLSFQHLYEVCRSLPGANVSGSKDEKIQRIIEYFDNLVVRDVPSEAPPGELYYRYLTELAARDRENLLSNKVIKKDREIEAAFEEGTRYLFAEKLGIDLLELEGADKPDGCFRLGGRGDLLMWDNKSKESVYTFPRSHLTQFKRYIRDSGRRVSCFLVIVPGVAEKAAQMAARLKVESGTDTDVALITAEDLVWVAEQWVRRGDEQFDPEVFNTTGILDRSTLEQRMRLFL